MIRVLSSSLPSSPALCLVPVWHRRLKSKVDYSGAFGAEGSDEGESSTRLGRAMLNRDLADLMALGPH